MTARNIPPRRAVEEYLRSRSDVQPTTRQNHKYRLSIFVEWAENEGIESMADLDGFDLQRYKNWRTNGDDAPDTVMLTIEHHLASTRVFLRWCEDAELVAEGLADKVILPDVATSDRSRDVSVAHERAQEIIEYYCRYEWATREHIIYHTLYHTGMRRSGLHALDVDDWNPEDRYLAVRNRPETGTRLKLGDNGERNVTIHDERLVDAINDWVDVRRPEVVDEHGREPLVASGAGRMYPQSITGVCYRITRPCEIGAECPHDRDPDECEAMGYSHASKCPSSVSAHPLRRSSITHHLSQDIPKEICSDRMSVSPEILDQHYDARDVEQRRQNREQYLDRL